MSDLEKNLHSIISRTNTSPTIVNADSSFVVVTYWWGRGNLNNNTARPCVSYYEDFFKNIIKLSVDLLVQYSRDDTTKFNKYINNLEKLIGVEKFKNIIHKKSREYLINLYSYAGVRIHNSSEINSKSKNEETMIFLEKKKSKGNTPANYEFKDMNYVYIFLYFIAIEFIKLNKKFIAVLYEIRKEVNELKKQQQERKTPKEGEKEKWDKENKAIAARVKYLVQLEKTTRVDINKSLNQVNQRYEVSRLNINIGPDITEIYNDPNIHGRSLNNLLVEELRYLAPLKFEEMIFNWEEKCRESKCNFMAVEYAEFARPGGYQMAINAKPLFIRKSLSLCGGRSVLYIDGDMNIRKYPIIFDLPNVDYMARGWWMDPRSSYKFEESISYDPYTFETSGGTMFFSNSEESRALLDMWIDESARPRQQGKADDRIISMIFNSKKLLLDLKTIQLPIEYLWLTLDYHERLLESDIYDYNQAKMENSLFIDHPECLTSEDTASGAGASSDRSPAYYNFLYDMVEPVSEEYYELLAFPQEKYKSGLEDYLNYMSEVYYIDDGNEQLYKKGFINPEEPEGDAAQPLYVVPYKSRFGKKQEIHDIIVKRAANIKTQGLYEYVRDRNLAVINNVVFDKSDGSGKKDTVKILSLIYKLLSEGKDVLYKPNSASLNEFIKTENAVLHQKAPGSVDVMDESSILTEAEKYDRLCNTVFNEFMGNYDTKYKNIEFAFRPIFNGNTYNDIYRPKVDLYNCIFIRSTSDFMKNFITLFESLEEMSGYVNYGFHQLMSSVRVRYFTLPRTSAAATSAALVRGGGGGDGKNGTIDHETEYINAMKYFDSYMEKVRKEKTPSKRISQYKSARPKTAVPAATATAAAAEKRIKTVRVKSRSSSRQRRTSVAKTGRMTRRSKASQLRQTRRTLIH